MKRYLVLAMFGWFFAYQHGGLEADPKALVRGIVGPFSSKDVCEQERMGFEDMLNAFGIPNSKVQAACVERADA